MEPAIIKERIAAGEDSKTEFKSVKDCDWDKLPHALAKAISAFANSGGGQIFLGVENDGEVTGIGNLEEADKLMQRVVGVCDKTVQPTIFCPIIKAKLGEKLLLVIDVPGFNPARPFRTSDIYYVRVANTSRPATQEELRRILQSPNVHFDEGPVTGASSTDLDPAAVQEFISQSYEEREAQNAQLLLKHLNCIDDRGTPTWAGMLMFGRDPSAWLVDAKISAVRFRGTQGSGEFADQKEIKGRLSDQARDAMAFLDLHMSQPSHVEGWQRVDTGIPKEVLREAVLNAIAHRDYSVASQIRIFIFDDRIEVMNPGGLLNQLTLENIRELGTTQRRNPYIAALLMKPLRRENLGVGIPEMFRIMKQRGLPEPELDLPAGGFRVVLRGRPAT